MAASSEDEMTAEQKRRDQLLRAEKSTEADAAPRIEVSHVDGNTRVDVADTAAVRPGPGQGVEADADAEGSENADPSSR